MYLHYTHLLFVVIHIMPYKHNKISTPTKSKLYPKCSQYSQTHNYHECWVIDKYIVVILINPILDMNKSYLLLLLLFVYQCELKARQNIHLGTLQIRKLYMKTNTESGELSHIPSWEVTFSNGRNAIAISKLCYRHG